MSSHPPSVDRPRRVALLGSTGSIGTSTLDVARHLPDRVSIVGLAANSKWEQLAEQCRAFKARLAVICDPDAFKRADRACFPKETQLLCGEDGVARLVTDPDVDVVVSAVVGAAGLAGTWAALEAGKTVALANKETLVVGGALVMDLAAARGATLLPVDSEHSAIFQALTGHTARDVTRVVLTASGGPFRGKRAADLEDVTPEQALKHPTWQMGPKITIDSATLMNKALEVIEARWLFGLAAEQIDVIVHPESVVHSFVEFADASVLAQLSPPDMRLPIQLALLHPARVGGPAKRLDWRTLSALHFEPADRETFAALDLGFEVARAGGTCGAVLNAANEAAVGRFLAGGLAFLDIARCCRAVLDSHDYEPRPTLERLKALDAWARQEVASWTRTRTPVR
ncbi:1-deoxy-D-xylulose-5-phosphate reductoisomerase [Frigoriglobus tundricola]|uniref:1-deoxy-D-xylulose 5-phosphate reductoisomerase n=1 Tax=Frigoriglobus tundricola TaxID=2774151 RepID=A0A6M5YVZ2_9BACT|nr:1-deoxy-D-xylulose-5-phosphate reductoisomerase [Frigoriglobus tundricola]QJW97072.1 1-deoxy-D-xylulose 5-phosphate reductoisomerase [Frigoriglobus tundricola]